MKENKKESSRNTDFLSHILEIDEISSQAGGINDLFYEFAKPHLDFLCENLQINQTGAALYAIMANLYNGDNISITRLAEHLNYKCIKILSYTNELELLEQKDLIHINWGNDNYHSKIRRKLGIISFDLRFTTLDALRKGSYHKLIPTKNLAIDKFFLQLEQLFEDLSYNRQSYKNMETKIKNLLQDNDHLLFVQKINKQALNYESLLILLFFFHCSVNHDESEITLGEMESLFDHSSDFVQSKRLLRTGNHDLLKRELIENTCSDGFSDDTAFCLTEAVKNEYLVELNNLLPNIPTKDLKRYNSISAKNLFYPEKTRLAIEELTSLLQPEYFLDVQKRLSENSMRTGFACLFSGSPGTGKTETAYQVARLTRRDIMHVDISDTKSK